MEIILKVVDSAIFLVMSIVFGMLIGNAIVRFLRRKGIIGDYNEEDM